MTKMIKMVFVAAFAGYGVYANQRAEAMSNLMLANVEALIGGEYDKGGPYICYMRQGNVWGNLTLTKNI